MLKPATSQGNCAECDQGIAPGDMALRPLYRRPAVPTGFIYFRVTLCETCAELYADSQEATGSRS